MTLQKLLQTLSTVKKGQFLKAHYKSEKVVNGDTYIKDTNGVVRLVQYSHINGVVVKGKVNPNEKIIVENTIYENTKTGNTLIQFAITNVKPNCKYYKNGVEISKQDYEMVNKPRANNGETIVFRVNINNLLELGNC